LLGFSSLSLCILWTGLAGLGKPSPRLQSDASRATWNYQSADGDKTFAK
jgi:hypothetical protein